MLKSFEVDLKPNAIGRYPSLHNLYMSSEVDADLLDVRAIGEMHF